jgi:hypothetical protein
VPNFPQASIRHQDIQKPRIPPSPGISSTSVQFPAPSLRSLFSKYPIPQSKGQSHVQSQVPVVLLCDQGAPGTSISPQQLGPPPSPKIMDISQIHPETEKENKSCPTIDVTNWQSQFTGVQFPNARNFRKKPENGPLFDLSEYDKKSLEFDRPMLGYADTIDPKLSLGGFGKYRRQLVMGFHKSNSR